MVLQQLRERFQERSRQRFLASCVDSNDDQLRQRVVAVVDALVAQAKTDGFLDRWHTGDGVHDTAEWDFKPYGSAQRTEHNNGRVDHALYTEHRLRGDAGPWLYATDHADFAVRFMPGGGFATAEAFLEHIATNARLNEER